MHCHPCSYIDSMVFGTALHAFLYKPEIRQYIYTQSANTLPQYSTMRWLCTLMQCILISNDVVIVFIESSLVEHVGGGQGLAVGRELLRCGGKVAMCEVVQWKGRTLP